MRLPKMTHFSYRTGCEEYSKSCRDFDYTGVKCCPTCHEDPEHELTVVIIDTVPCLVCCQLMFFFYPQEDPTRWTPDEKLLNAIFGRRHEQKND